MVMLDFRAEYGRFVIAQCIRPWL